MSYLFVLGASDPEMTAIETVIDRSQHVVAHSYANARRVHSGNAYAWDSLGPTEMRAVRGARVVLVECAPARAELLHDAASVVCVDHHRAGDPGYNRPPPEYWAASSLGQVCTMLGVVATAQLKLVAAADHCLSAAYAGICPGVDPVALGEWRIASRGAFQRRAVEAVRADIERAMAVLQRAPRDAYGVVRVFPGDDSVLCGQHGAECSGMTRTCWGDVPELPEAAVRLGVAFVARPRPGPDGRAKLVLQAATPKQVQNMLDGHYHSILMEDGSAARIVDVYGDPQRGFAGGYLA